MIVKYSVRRSTRLGNDDDSVWVVSSRNRQSQIFLHRRDIVWRAHHQHAGIREPLDEFGNGPRRAPLRPREFTQVGPPTADKRRTRIAVWCRTKHRVRMSSCEGGGVRPELRVNWHQTVSSGRYPKVRIKPARRCHDRQRLRHGPVVSAIQVNRWHCRRTVRRQAPPPPFYPYRRTRH